MIHAEGTGCVLSLIAIEPEVRDPALPESVRDAIFESVTTNEMVKRAAEVDDRERVANRAVALKATLSGSGSELTPCELSLLSVLSEWLDRLALQET